MKKIIVIPRRSDTLCERCIHSRPPHKLVGCLYTQIGSPCIFFKRDLPKLIIGTHEIIFRKDGLNIMYIGNNEREVKNNENNA